MGVRAALRVALPVAASLLVCAAAPAFAQVAKLHPVDEAARQPDFFSFRARLLQAAEARDTAALYAVLAPDILNSFGGDGGIAEFRSMWRPEDPDSEVWSVLTEVLSLGGAFVPDGSFVAPYTSAAFPDGFDGFEHVAVTGANVRARERPGTDTAVLATLSFDVLPLVREPREMAEGWVAVRLADGREAHVSAGFVRSPNAHRARFVRRGGRWLLRSLVQGD